MRFHVSGSTQLTYKKRSMLPKSAFAYPSKAPGGGSYPIPTIAQLQKIHAPNPHESGPRHARSALARVSANGTPAEKRRICEIVHRRYPKVHAESCKMH